MIKSDTLESTAKVTSGARWVCFIQNKALSAYFSLLLSLESAGQAGKPLFTYVCVYLYNTYTPVCNYRFVLCRGNIRQDNLDPEAIRNLQLSPITSELKILHQPELIFIFLLNDSNKYMIQFEPLNKIPPSSI